MEYGEVWGWERFWEWFIFDWFVGLVEEMPDP